VSVTSSGRKVFLQPLSSTYKLVQLAMRGYRLSPRHGIRLDVLSHRCKMRTGEYSLNFSFHPSIVGERFLAKLQYKLPVSFRGEGYV